MQRRNFLASSLLLLGSPYLAPAAASSKAPARQSTSFMGLGDTIAAPASDTGLAQRFPRLAASLPRLPLSCLPTPIQAAPHLGAHLGVPKLSVKRDELISNLYGGSKVRKLEYFLGQAMQEGRGTIITGGSLGSHHALATAVHGSAHGFDVELLLLPEPSSREVDGVLAASTARATRIRRIPTAAALQLAWNRSLLSHGNGAYSIPLGGSSPLGALGTIEAAFELERQVQQGALEEPERIYVALGTMSTAVGLALGLEMTGLQSKVIAVRASNPGTSTMARCRRLFEKTIELLKRLDPSFPDLGFPSNRFTIDGRHLGLGYALPTERGRQMQALAMQLAKLELELTYTAKTLAALAADGKYLGERPVLFWNTHAGPPPPTTRAQTERQPNRGPC